MTICQRNFFLTFIFYLDAKVLRGEDISQMLEENDWVILKGWEIPELLWKNETLKSEKEDPETAEEDVSDD